MPETIYVLLIYSQSTIESMSERLRDDEEIAELLSKHKNADYLLKKMSSRIQELYEIK